jgi:spermidine/putrescine transport system substrate-binding protein
MSETRKPPTSAELTVRAAKAFSRRTILKATAAAAGVAAVGPWYVKDALSSSGSLNLLVWDDELPNPVVPDFEKKTGIKVNLTPFSQNEEQINKLQATRGQGFDLCQPTHDRAPQFEELDVLTALDEKKLTLDNVIPSLLNASRTSWTWGGKLYHVPHCWGTEALSWRNDMAKLEYKTLSYGTLWSDEFKGKAQGRPHSLLLTIGLTMDANGKLPSNRMLDAYKDEDTMKKIYDVLLKEAIAKKASIKQFWDSSDSTKNGFMTNGVVIGQTWDGPAISLKKAGQPITFMAPQEGAIGWVDGFALTKAAANVEQAYEWLKYIHTAETAAKVAEGSGYNPVAKGADALLSDKAKAIFQEAYPGDALEKLWWRPVEPSWFAELRTQYAEKFKTA